MALDRIALKELIEEVLLDNNIKGLEAREITSDLLLKIEDEYFWDFDIHDEEDEDDEDD